MDSDEKNIVYHKNADAPARISGMMLLAIILYAGPSSAPLIIYVIGVLFSVSMIIFSGAITITANEKEIAYKGIKEKIFALSDLNAVKASIRERRPWVLEVKFVLNTVHGNVSLFSMKINENDEDAINVINAVSKIIKKYCVYSDIDLQPLNDIAQRLRKRNPKISEWLFSFIAAGRLEPVWDVEFKMRELCRSGESRGVNLPATIENAEQASVNDAVDFQINARVQDAFGAKGVVVFMDPHANHGMGVVRVKYDDGRCASFALIASGLSGL